MKSSSEFLIISTFTILLMGCGGSFKKAVDEEIEEQNPVVLDDSEEDIIEEESEFEIKEHVFNTRTRLSEDLNIRAERVVFPSGSYIELGQFDINISANSVEFNSGVVIIGFEEFDYNECFKNGEASGSLTIQAESISGSPVIELAGQDAGLAGMYLLSSSGKQLDKAHTKRMSLHEVYENECLNSFNGIPSDMGIYRESYSGGNGGKIQLNFLPTEVFIPSISIRVSHGSYEAVVDVGNGRVSGSIVNKEGAPGTPTKLCYLVSGEELCQ
jgi:hypothetical protein